MMAWFNGHDAAQIGSALADEFAPRTGSGVAQEPARNGTAGSTEHLLKRADSEVRPLRLNFYKKAKLANSFKWRLIENGVAKKTADELTQALVVHLSQKQIPGPQDAPANPPDRSKAQQLFHRGNKLLAQGSHADAAAVYEQAVQMDSSNAEALNNLGSALCYLARYDEAERYFRQSIATKPNNPVPHANLGNLQRIRGQLLAAEASLRHALKLLPKYTEARINLGLTLIFLGRLRDAKACYAKVLKSAPRNIHALDGMAQIALLEGKFDEAESTFKRLIEIDPKMPKAWAGLASTRKMTRDDSQWLERAGEIATSGIDPLEEANLRFAMGKFCDDVSDFPQAFENFKRGNELLKLAAADYDRKGRSRFIDDQIRLYSQSAISKMESGGSPSTKPVFVVGMPRSGTSVVEQIIATHPAAYGAGELQFWDRLNFDEAGMAKGVLGESDRLKVAEKFLDTIDGLSTDALRVVDKSPVNADYLGLIYSVFPNARVIYMQRDAVDTCLSCYFQQFLASLNYTFDLSDLVHYYREHQRIMAHWRAVLPAGFILDVRYEDLVTNQETWSRKMLDFVGLEWESRVMDFHTTQRIVNTASALQVRQKLHKGSVARWRNYEKFIGPLKALQK